MAKKVILVVDDDSSIRGLVRAVLQRQDFEVAEAATGNEAIARLREKKYDGLVLDLMMGEGSGLDVLKVVAEQRPDVKCVVMISAASAAKIEKIDAANVVAKLRKPFDIGDLLQAIQRCVEQ